MRHYEIILLIHPDQDKQLTTMVERYQTLVKQGGGAVHRYEHWGRRPLAYTINKNITKAHYVLLNIECDQKTLDELEHNFRFNDHVLRHLTLSRKVAVTVDSPMKNVPPPRERGSRDGDRRERSTYERRERPAYDRRDATPAAGVDATATGTAAEVSPDTSTKDQATED